jgi:hypothetical protein
MDRPSPPRDNRRPRELSFYKKSARDPRRERDERPSATSGSTGSFSTRRDPLDRMGGAGRERDRDRERNGDRERERSPPRRRGTDEEELERRRREYRGGAPLERVPTRDERRDRGEPREREREHEDERGNGRAGYRGGDELRRVETRNEPKAAKQYVPRLFRLSFHNQLTSFPLIQATTATTTATILCANDRSDSQ